MRVSTNENLPRTTLHGVSFGGRMKVDYDESIIHQFAQRLYSRASTIVVVYAFFGLLF